MDRVVHDRVDRLIQRGTREYPELDINAKAITGRIVRVYNMVMRRFEPVFESHGVNFFMYITLAHLRLAGEPYELRPKELLKSSVITSGGLSNILNRLQKMGLIARSRDNEDGRGVMVNLTSAGKDLIDNLYAEIVSKEHEMTRVISKDEMEQLGGLLRKFLMSNEF